MLEAPSVTLVVKDGVRASAGSVAPRGPMVVVGPCSSGTANEVTPLTNTSDLTSTFGYGPAVEAAGYALAFVGCPQVLLIRTDDTDEDAGEYGDITQEWDSADAPTVDADDVLFPGDDLEPMVRFPVGGILGVTGIKYQYSLDNGRQWSGNRDLGTLTSITLPYGGGKYNLGSPGLVDLANDIRAKFMAHIINVTGSVHGAPDTDSDNSVPAAATTDVQAVALVAALLAASAAHFAMLSSVHGAADTAGATALAAIVTPTTAAMAVTAANALKDALNDHMGRQPTIHGAADANTVIEADAVQGVVTAGDGWYLQTKAPRWHIDKLIDALTVVKNMTRPFALIQIVGPILTDGEAQAIGAALEGMRAKVKYKRAVGHFRLKDADETSVQYGADYEAAFANTTVLRLAIAAGCFYAPSSYIRGAVIPRPWSLWAAARLSIVEEKVNPISYDDFGGATGQIRDTKDKLLPRAIDESIQEIFTPLRAWAPMIRPDAPLNSGVHSSQAGLLAMDQSDYSTIQFGRVADLACTEAHKQFGKYIGKDLLPAPDGRMDPTQRARIDGAVTELVRKALNGQAADVRAWLDPDVIITQPPPVLMKAYCRLQAFGYIDKMEIQFSLSATAP